MNYIYFFIVFAYRWVLGKYSNYLVYRHFMLTPRIATEDTATEIKLEKIRYKQRKIEQKRYILQTKMNRIAERIGVHV